MCYILLEPTKQASVHTQEKILRIIDGKLKFTYVEGVTVYFETKEEAGKIIKDLAFNESVYELKITEE